MTKSATPEKLSVSGFSSRRSWQIAIVLALFALFSGVLLVGVSVWFLGAVALVGGTAAALTFNFHHPAALIRLLAIARTAGKYGERVAGHRAALYDQVNRRRKLFLAMSRGSEVRQAGWQLAREDRLTDYIDDVEDLDYRRLRSDMPAAIMLFAAAALFLLTLWLFPHAALVACAAALALWFMLRLLAPAISQHAENIRMSRRTGAGHIGAMLSAFTPLTAEGERETRIDWSFTPLSEAIRAEHAQSRALAFIDNAFNLAGLLVGFAVILAAWFAGLRGAELLPAGFVAFSWIALSDQAHMVSKICLGRVRAQAARKHMSAYDTTLPVDKRRQENEISVSKLSLVTVPLAAPDGRWLGGDVSFNVDAGVPLIISGPSGCGKSTLLKTVAGLFEYGASGQITFDGVMAYACKRRQSVHLGLHDAAILLDTVRENLFAPRAGDDALWQALEAVELAERIRQACGLDAWIAQTDFSLGEVHRLALARAWLSGRPIILLDEPEAHLDEEQAVRIISRLYSRCANRILIHTSHSEKTGGTEATHQTINIAAQ